MATVNATIRNYKNKDGDHAVYIRVSHKGVNRFISTGVYIPKSKWSKRNQEIKKSLTGWDKLNKHIDKIAQKYQDNIYALEASSGEYDVDDIVRERSPKSSLFFPFANKYCEKFKNNPRITTYKRYTTVVRKFKEFSDEKLKFPDITVSLLTDFETYLKSIGNSVNTIHSNLKVIRTIYYQAIKEGIAKQEDNPFFVFKLKKKKVMKEKLTEEELNKLIEVEIDGGFLDDTRNYFLASYYMAGMRFGDLCVLKKKNFRNGFFQYQMSKTGRKMTLEVNDQLKQVLNKYEFEKKGKNDFIFPLLKANADYSNSTTLSNHISSRNAQVNSSLKDLAEAAEIEKILTFHMARHTFADISRKKGVDIYDISKLLGHSSIKQTESYLASLDTESMNKAFKKAYE